MFSLHDPNGQRKYVTITEREAYLEAVRHNALGDISTFCPALAYTGVRISEALQMTPRRVDFGISAFVVRSLKKRKEKTGQSRISYRIVPVPDWFLDELDRRHGLKQAQKDPARADERIWQFGRTRAWEAVKEMMALAGIEGPQATPKGLRHGFVVAALEAGVPLNIVQRWLGHVKIETTAIYANAIGSEERRLAERFWGTFGKHPK